MPPFLSGDKVTLKCDITAQEKGWDYHWEWNYNLLPDKTSKNITVTVPDENGRYRCYVRRKGASHLAPSSDNIFVSSEYLY